MSASFATGHITHLTKKPTLKRSEEVGGSALEGTDTRSLREKEKVLSRLS